MNYKKQQIKSIFQKGIGFLTISGMLLVCPVGNSQNADTNYRTSVAESLKKVEEFFKIDIKDERQLLAGKELEYADWRIYPGNLEVSLSNLLSPFDLSFSKESDSVYNIKKFQYHKIPQEIGAQRLAFLSNRYNDLESWKVRKQELQSCMKQALLLDKAPEKPDSEPILTKKRTYKGYSVENIALEILPGVYTTGSVYKPYPLEDNLAIILTPNGHFGDGRYRESQQFRCATLAKMGAVVVSYDLFAWGESQLQFSSKTHRNSISQTIQILNGLRLLDYLEQLPETDADRVGVTGGSGGASSTLFLTAIDERIKVSVPAVMVSAHHSGGCPCESGQPIHLCGNGTNNPEIAALAAPRPQLIISDGGDWTQNVPEVEYPFIKNIYEFFGKGELVKNTHFPEEGHDYGVSKRMAMYPFMAKHLELDLKNVQDNSGEIVENNVEIESENELKVFGDNGENLPKNALKNIDKLYAMFGEKNKRKNEK